MELIKFHMVHCTYLMMKWWVWNMKVENYKTNSETIWKGVLLFLVISTTINELPLLVNLYVKQNSLTKKRELTETSGPSSSSSMITLSPAAPNFLSTRLSRTAEHASALSAATTTPLPAASPLAFTTRALYGALCNNNNWTNQPSSLFYEIVILSWE